MPLEKQQIAVLFTSALFLVTNSCDVLLTKFLNYEYKVKLPYFMVLCVNAYWPIMLVWYLMMVHKRGKGWPLDKKTAIYLSILGVVSFLLSACRSYAANNLPGSIYVIVLSSDVAFTTILTKIFLKKYMTKFHYLAVVLACLGVAVVTIGKQTDSNYECGESGCLADWAVPIIAALVGSLLSAGNAVFSELVLVGRSKSLRNVVEVGWFYSMWPFLLSPIPMAIAGENEKLGSGNLSSEYDIVNNGMLGGMVATLVAMCFAKMIFRLAKFHIISVKSAFYFSILNVFQRALSTILAMLLFNETSNIQKFAALALTSSAMGSYIYGSLLKKRLGIKDAMRANRKDSKALDEALLADVGMDAEADDDEYDYAEWGEATHDPAVVSNAGALN